MGRAAFLADTSVFARLSKPSVAAVMTPMIAEGLVVLCAPIIFELGFSARNGTDYDLAMSGLAAFGSLPVTDGDNRRALDIQRLLAGRGQHRALSLVDALVAAVAEARDVTVLHYDEDFELVSEITGQPHLWVVERGTAD